jgi:hypothetical protein
MNILALAKKITLGQNPATTPATAPKPVRRVAPAPQALAPTPATTPAKPAPKRYVPGTAQHAPAVLNPATPVAAAKPTPAKAVTGAANPSQALLGTLAALEARIVALESSQASILESMKAGGTKAKPAADPNEIPAKLPGQEYDVGDVVGVIWNEADGTQSLYDPCVVLKATKADGLFDGYRVYFDQTGERGNVDADRIAGPSDLSPVNYLKLKGLA